jgi:CheY-like chemotaxis protein
MHGILLIDDDETLRQTVADILAFEGYEVVTAADGVEGLHKARATPPDLILCDIVMPGPSGYEVYEGLQQDEQLSEVPVIFLSGLAEQEQVRRGMNFGVDDYLTKPVSKRDLLEAVATRIEKSRQVKERTRRRIWRVLREARATPALGQITLCCPPVTRVVRLAEIVTISACGEYSTVATTDGSPIMVRKALRTWQQELPELLFVRVHRSQILNVSQVKRWDRLPNRQIRVYLNGRDVPVLASCRHAAVLVRALQEVRGGEDIPNCGGIGGGVSAGMEAGESATGAELGI